ncbi:site-specific integrase [Thioclava electrotropha]|uniref:Site-specific integrase n=1 Tax=Thioclava electrotropha TaxID=1549850 RepID=A0ABX6YW03_9RHOB|nr:site-specific integrase [Thioclava electrotropha]QPZ92052.1 site-specific integrase [Thioclava electrotropha]
MMQETTITPANDTRDLERALWLSKLTPASRNATIASLRTLTGVIGRDGRLSVNELEDILLNSSEEVRAELGDRAAQLLSDARRALRVWSDEPTRWFASNLRGRIPTLRDAQEAAGLTMTPDEAKRASSAMEALASAEQCATDDIAATEATISAIFKRLSPEEVGCTKKKTFENKRSLCLRAVRLVDCSRKKARKNDLANMSEAAKRALTAVEERLKEHETSALAIVRRFVLFADHFGADLENLDPDLPLSFYEAERSNFSNSHEEKLRRFVRVWNEAACVTGLVTELPPPRLPVLRQASVAWDDVPECIRVPLDRILEKAVSARLECAWEDLVSESMDDEYAEFGIFDDAGTDAEQEDAAIVIEPGTRKNWRDAAKRAWHAAEEDHRITSKPESLEDLFDVSVAKAMVVGARKARRARMEVRGEIWNAKEKGRYEHSLVETLCAIARHIGIDERRLSALEEFKVSIDPMVVATKLKKDGTKTRVYTSRRIGKRHKVKLARFSEESRLRRYFEAPGELWKMACKGLQKGRRPSKQHIALARNALFLRISQYTGPLRRTSLVGLRHEGDDPHLILPAGSGTGTLMIPAIETKTLSELHIQIDPETVKMIKYYIAHFLPEVRRLAGACGGNPHLFPGYPTKNDEASKYAPGMGHMCKEKANNTFRNQLWRHFRIDLNLHVMRHLAGKIILDQDPSAMELVRILLDHRRLETTQSYYAEVNAIIAQHRYLHLLEKSQRSVLAKVNFKLVEDPACRNTG